MEAGKCKGDGADALTRSEDDVDDELFDGFFLNMASGETGLSEPETTLSGPELALDEDLRDASSFGLSSSENFSIEFLFDGVGDVGLEGPALDVGTSAAGSPTGRDSTSTSGSSSNGFVCNRPESSNVYSRISSGGGKWVHMWCSSSTGSRELPRLRCRLRDDRCRALESLFESLLLLAFAAFSAFAVRTYS